MTQQARLRLAFGIILLAALAWLPIEDTQTVWGLLLAAATSAILAAYWYLRNPTRLQVLPVIGAAAGAVVPLIAAAFFLVKTGLHGHAAPDFTWEEYWLVFRSTPAWLVGGLLLGSGMALRQAVSRRRDR